MTGLNQDERKSIAEKLMEFGNLSGAGFAIAQFVPTGQTISAMLIWIGVAFWLGFWIIAISIMRGGGRT